MQHSTISHSTDNLPDGKIQLPPSMMAVGEIQASGVGQKPAGGWSSTPPGGGGGMMNGGGGMGGGAQGPGAGGPASVGELFSNFFLLFGKSFGPLIAAYTCIELVVMLLYCPGWILELILVLGRNSMDNDAALMLGENGRMCAGLVSMLGLFLLGGVRAAVFRSVRHTLVVGKDQVGGVSGVFAAAIKKTPAALLIMLVGGLVSGIAGFFCVIPGLILMPIVALTLYMVVACDEPLKNGLSEAVRLAKLNIGPTVVWVIVALVAMGVMVGSTFGLSFLMALLEDWGPFTNGVLIYGFAAIFSYVMWLWTGAYCVTLETRDCNLPLVR